MFCLDFDSLFVIVGLFGVVSEFALSLFGCLEKWKGVLFGKRSKAICYLYGQALLFLAPFLCFSCQPNIERASIVMNC